MRLHRLLLGMLLPPLALACSSDTAVAPSQECDSASSVVTLDPLQGTELRAADFGRCARLAGMGARYLVVPQFASADTGPVSTSFLLAASDVRDVGAAMARRVGAPMSQPAPLSAQRQLDHTLRRLEGELAAAYLASPDAGVRPAVRARVAAAPLATSRSFKVLSKLEGGAFETVTADLKFTGDKIAIYVDRNAPPGGFGDAEYDAFGRLFDQDLYPIDTRAFGSESDLDANGHVVVLFTPVVNSLTKPSGPGGCSTYVAGFFFGLDLASTGENSNKGEVFYSAIADPGGVEGCALSQAQIRFATPSTFIHEFQHMISFNQHVLVRRAKDEDVWLNEGLSHIAEELGSLHFERKYPGTSGRTDPTQLFPDSAQGFITPNLGNAYDYLRQTTAHSVTTFEDFGSTEERGAAWLFLRWLGDQKGEEVFGRLVQTNLTGTANVASAAGQSFPQLFGDFGTAIWVDNLPGVAREQIPAQFHFTSRDFRAIFGRLSALSPGDFPEAYPVSPIALESGGASETSMLQGTMDFYILQTRAADPTVTLRFSNPDRTQLARTLEPQLAVFRLPDAAP